MSFKSLVNKLVKEGKSREAATKIAGKVANAKMKGAGSGPTAKQKARMKGSPANKVVDKKKIRKKEQVESEGGQKATNVSRVKEVTKSRRGGKVTVTKSKTKNSLNTGKFRVTELKEKGRKTKSKTKEVKGKSITHSGSMKDAGERKRMSKRTYTTKGQQRDFNDPNVGYEGKSKYKEKNYGEGGTYRKGAKTKTKSPANMKKQGYNARLDDSLSAKHGKKSQSLKSRRDESEGMEKSMKRRKFSGNKSSAQGSAAKFNKGLKKASADGKLDNNPKFKAAVDASPAKMNGKTLKKTTAKAKDTKGVKTVQPKRSKTLVKNIEKKIVTKKGVKTGSLDAAKSKRSKANAAAARKQGYMMNYNTGQYQATPNKRGAERRKESGLNRFQAYDQMDTRNAAQTAGSPMGMYGKHSPANAYGKSPMNAYGKSPMKMSHGKSPMKMKGKGGCAISKHMGGRR